MSDPSQKSPPQMPDDQHWLASFPTPAPSAQCLQRIKSAIRTELSRATHDTEPPRPQPAIYRLLAALAAAAVLAAAVGTIRFVSPEQPAASPAGSIELFLASLDALIQQQDQNLAALQQDLQRFEAELLVDLGQSQPQPPGPAGPTDQSLLGDWVYILDS
ncbi:MAG: hypothetical protein ACE5K7_01430 [Phycisphaerae bacterium]